MRWSWVLGLRQQASLVTLVAAVIAGCAADGTAPVPTPPSTPIPNVLAITAIPEPAGNASPSPAPTSTATPAAVVAPASAAQPAPSPQVAVPLTVGTVPRDTLRITPLSRGTTGTRTVVIDPGHGADEIGAAAGGVVEKTSNLEMALRVEALLQAQGVRVQLTRRTDERAYVGAQDGGFNSTRRDLQARVDLANDVGADLFVSIHSNGSASGADRGIETYYNSQRPFADQNRVLGVTLQAALVGEMQAAGYAVLDRGAKDDACLRAFQGRCFPLFVLGPPRVTTRDEVVRRGGDPSTFGFGVGEDAVGSRATSMPGALVELLFISSPADAALLASEDARAALARGVARGIIEFLAR